MKWIKFSQRQVLVTHCRQALRERALLLPRLQEHCFSCFAPWDHWWWVPALGYFPASTESQCEHSVLFPRSPTRAFVRENNIPGLSGRLSPSPGLYGYLHSCMYPSTQIDIYRKHLLHLWAEHILHLPNWRETWFSTFLVILYSQNPGLRTIISQWFEASIVLEWSPRLVHMKCLMLLLLFLMLLF